MKFDLGNVYHGITDERTHLVISWRDSCVSHAKKAS